MAKYKNNTFQEDTLEAIQQLQLSGMAYYSDKIFFSFYPDNPVKERVLSYRRQGVAQQMSDGTFDFIAQPQRKPQSTLIKKLPHGRLSKTKDEAIQITLKVYCDEKLDIKEALLEEALSAVRALNTSIV